MDPLKPSLELVRALTDEHVLRALLRRRRLTRAELAAETGISKPTIGESVRRLTEAGLVADTGERTPGGRGRGRVGSYYALADVRTALAVGIAPEGIVAECLDAYGDTLARAEQTISRPVHADQVAAVLTATVKEATSRAGARPELAVVSAADPVDRASGRMVHLPDSPFLLGDLDAAAVLEPHVGGAVTVDNDVNWAARAERDAATAGGLENFAYLYLGEGLGCAVVSDGDVRRGHSGLAGEISHLITIGPQGQAMRLIDVFAALDLRQRGSTAIDLPRLLAAVKGPAKPATALLRALGQAVSGALSAIVTLADPELVIIGGPWGTDPQILNAIAAAVAGLPRQIALRPAQLITEPSLAGARTDALHRLRSAIVADAQRAAAS